MVQIELSAGRRRIPGTGKVMDVTYNYLKHTSQSKFRRWTIENLNKALVEKLHLLKVDSIVDVGCGEGFTLNRFSKEKLAKKLVGIDGSSIAIELGRVLFPDLNLKSGNIYKIPLNDSSYDVVVCTEVLEHLEDPRKGLKELIRVSNKYLTLSVPNEPIFSLKNLFIGKNIRRLGSSVEHINWWTSKAFLKFVSMEKVEVLSCCHPFPFTLVLLKKR